MDRYRLNKKYRFTDWRLISGMLAILLIFVLGIVWFSHRKPMDASKKEMEKVRSQVGKLVILPSGEEPTLATVTDKSKLDNNGLYKNAENGDQLLLFYKAQKAYLYRPKTNKVVDIGPLSYDASAAEVQGTRIMVRNGSGDDKRVKDIESKLRDYYKTAQVVPEDHQAARLTYPQTIVVDLTADNTKYNLVSNIAEGLGAQRGILPNGEVAPKNIDVLIITGLQ